MAILTLDGLCKSLAPVFEALGMPAPSAYDVLDELTRREQAKLASLNRGLSRTANRGPQKRLPLRDEKGSAYGYVSDELPADLYWNLRAQKRFGQAGLESAEGRKDIRKAWPQLFPRTVSGKTTVAVGINFRNANFGGLKPAV